MGLDIYLHTAEEARQNAEYGRASSEWYGGDDTAEGESPRDKATEAERAQWHKDHDYATHENPPSERYPDHLFNRRYLRSSYNGSGFNHAVPQMLATSENDYPNERGSLAWIFEPVRLDDQYEVELTAASVDALRQAKSRALEVAEELRTADRLRVMEVGPNIFGPIPTIRDDDALKLYREQVATGRVNAESWWSNRDMNVFGDGLSVLAAIAGTGTLGGPCVHLIYRQAEAGYDSYIQSAEIVAEFCDEAIALIERDGSCEMTWSG